MEESIYNIVPREFVPPPKQPIYRSKYPPNIPPTGSIFGNHTTSKPHVSVLSFRARTFRASSHGGCKGTPSSGSPRPWATSKGTESPTLKTF